MSQYVDPDTEPDDDRWTVKDGNVVAWNEGGMNGTEVPLADVIRWAAVHEPWMLRVALFDATGERTPA